ncbi:MAG: integrase catalytic domain-containing protein [Bacteroidales bacterium]|nr:integrase catalytic domain-containing protein [Bacteroidales bacterium]
MNGLEYEKTVQEAGALAKTRDLFCFCAFTSLRYSDMAALKRTDITEDKLYITTQKTNDRLPIDLSKNAQAILEKHKGSEFSRGLALPVISNQKMNKYLKDLGELCGFNTPISKTCYRAGQRVDEIYPKYELIGTHAARRTFICFALSNGIPPQVVMKWTGHSDYKAMKPYIDIAEKTKSNAMKLIDNAWKM